MATTELPPPRAAATPGRRWSALPPCGSVPFQTPENGTPIAAKEALASQPPKGKKQA
jgi:hypothetical protein